MPQIFRTTLAVVCLATVAGCGGLSDGSSDASSAPRRPSTAKASHPTATRPAAPHSPAKAMDSKAVGGGKGAGTQSSRGSEAAKDGCAQDDDTRDVVRHDLVRHDLVRHDLVGMDEGELQRVLGKPIAVKDSAPGKTWRYRNRCCELSVALYPNLQTHSYQVLSYEVTSDDSSNAAKPRCLAALQHDSATGPDAGE